jgi:hypothetical protein
MRRTLLTILLVVISGVALAAPVAAQVKSESIVIVGGEGTVGSFTVNVLAFQFHRHAPAFGLLGINNGPGFFTVSLVRCIRVLENTVLVGGVIVHAANPDLIGHTSMIAVEDVGPGGADNLGIAFSPSGLDSCPVFSLPMYPVTSGDFVVYRA